MNTRALRRWFYAIGAAMLFAWTGVAQADEPPAAPVGVAGEGATEILLLDVGGGSAYGSESTPGYGGSPYGDAYGAGSGLGGVYSGRAALIAGFYEPATPESVAAQREQLIASLRQLQDAYCRAAMLDEALAVRDQIRTLESFRSKALPPIPTPGMPGPGSNGSAIDDGDPYSLRGRNGESFYAEVTGTTTGSVWGDDVYTDDSDLATAAVHAGVLQEGETKVVKFTILPGQDSYASSSENGVSTSTWGSYGGSFRVDAAAMRISYPYTLRGEGLERLPVFVVGDPNAGTVWGTDVYTDDSALDAAAVHAGIVTPGQKAIVTIELLAGKESYEGSERNGVTSASYNSWQASYRFLPDESSPKTDATEQSPYELRGRNGETFSATVKGSTLGSVWGDGIYTDDSDLATAAVHAGVLDDGEIGTVRFTILPGRESYGSSTKNGVTTRTWRRYGGSFRIEGAKDESPSTGIRETLQVTGSTEGSVWGSGVYTSDSDIGTAAVHAGFLRPGETKFVTVERLPGRDSYTGSTSNGVTTYDYGSWSASFRFVDEKAAYTRETSGETSR